MPGCLLTSVVIIILLTGRVSGHVCHEHSEIIERIPLHLHVHAAIEIVTSDQGLVLLLGCLQLFRELYK